MGDKKKITLEYPSGYSQDTSHYWPMPATQENKMVSQLDDVARESEAKATEIFDILNGVYSEFVDKEKKISDILKIFDANIILFEKLNLKFPEVKAFDSGLRKNKAALQDADNIFNTFCSDSELLINCMDVMQYQDINRQKIERVINVMRSLSNYMNNLLEGKLKEDKRAPSACHIVGDSHNRLVSNDEIEELLSQFAN